MNAYDVDMYETMFGYITATIFFTFAILLIPTIIILTLKIIGQWKIFEKAGIQGWKALIPFYADYCLCKMTFGEGLFFLIFLIPGANLIMQMILGIYLAKAFGKEIVFGILTGLFPFVMYLILGFSDSIYIGPQMDGF